MYLLMGISELPENVDFGRVFNITRVRGKPERNEKVEIESKTSSYLVWLLIY